MKSKNIPVSVVDRRIDVNPIFGGITFNLNGQEYFDEHQISLPIHEALSIEDIDFIIATILEGW
jgi:dTDP-4-amino-4,6-dideoxygalactose transaminase